MAYKDEYEVARLYTDPAFAARLKAQFEGDFRLSFHLAIPLLRRPDPTTGEPRKRSFGPWTMAVFRVLARMKRLRGGPLDPFARSPDRRLERSLIDWYFALVEELADGLTEENYETAVALAALPGEDPGLRAGQGAERGRRPPRGGKVAPILAGAAGARGGAGTGRRAHSGQVTMRSSGSSPRRSGTARPRTEMPALCTVSGSPETSGCHQARSRAFRNQPIGAGRRHPVEAPHTVPG